VTAAHTAEIRRASGSLGGFLAWCTTDDCGWRPDVVHPNAQAATIAAATHVLDNRPTETTE
jgi:hypothetical protein